MHCNAPKVEIAMYLVCSYNECSKQLFSRGLLTRTRQPYTGVDKVPYHVWRYPSL